MDKYTKPVIVESNVTFENVALDSGGSSSSTTGFYCPKTSYRYTITYHPVSLFSWKMDSACEACTNKKNYLGLGWWCNGADGIPGNFS